MFGRTAGLLAAVLYASMILPVALAQAAAHDVALVVWVTLARPPLLGIGAHDDATGRRRHAPCCWAWSSALAILTKGLAGVALVGIA